MTARKGEAIEPWLPPAQPCPADCRVTLQEHSTQLFHSAGKTCSAVCPGQALLPPKLCPHSWAGQSRAVPVSHLPDPTSASTRTHSTFPSPVQLPNRALILPHVSRICEAHKPQLSPHFSRLPWSPKDLCRTWQIKRLTLRSTRGAFPPKPWGRGASPGPHQQPGQLWGASGECREAPARAASCRPVPSQFKGCPAGSK